ncbi:unnamed protein product [Fusarium fujikuroi]|nr:unnamed protein product [Fusarium fujikuroi]
MVSTLTYETAHMMSSGIPVRPILAEGDIMANYVLVDKMLSDGWCESHVHMLASQMDAAAMYYIGTLGPPMVKKDHIRCSNEKCEADQVIESEYVTSHRTKDCNCEHIGPDMGKVTECLGNERFPYIELTVQRNQLSGTPKTGNSSTIRMKVVPFEVGKHYIALSHVWSGGLGNPHGNTLPKCQLIWIHEKIAALPHDLERNDDTVSFWMDTLCVPLQPESARRGAIRFMHRTYAKATAVLVLDQELLLSTMQWIMDAPDDRKFQELIRLQKTFIKGMLFLSGPKMTDESYGWAPLALMAKRGTEVLDLVVRSHRQEVWARWTPDGLLGEWYGFEIFDINTNPIPETFTVVCRMNGKQYVVTRAVEPDAENQVRQTREWQETTHNTAIILESSPDYLKDTFASLAVLAEIRYKDRGICSTLERFERIATARTLWT